MRKWAGLGIGLMVLALSSSAFAISITGTSDATALVNNILGSGVSLVGAPTLTGVTNQQGTFTSGGIGFNSGIVLTSGNATQIPGTNAGQPAESLGGEEQNPNFSTDLGTGGYAPLTALSGFDTNDANVLTFQFQFGDGTSTDNSLYFNYVFASEEYIDFVGTEFNDVFGLFLDGVNLATIGGQAITINNINPVSNSSLYVNNVNNIEGYSVAGIDFKFDGLTTVLQAQALGIGAGTHTMTFAVADSSDHILDAGVFIQQGTFSTTPTGVPEPSTMLLLGSGLLGLVGLNRRRKG